MNQAERPVITLSQKQNQLGWAKIFMCIENKTKQQKEGLAM